MAKRSPGAILKSKGLIPKDWNLRDLSRGQKSWITKLTQPAKTLPDGTKRKSGIFSELIKRPGEFTTISAKSKTHRSQARAAGLPTTNGRAVVKGKSVRRKANGNLSIKTSGGRNNEVYFLDRDNFGAQYDRLSKIKLAHNQVWKLRIGEHYSNDSFTNLDDLIQYAKGQSDMQKWHDEEYVSQHVAFVLVTVDRQHFVKHHPSNK